MKPISPTSLPPSFSELCTNPILMLGFGFGSGLVPKAPGTAGTLFGALLFIPLIIWSEWLAWCVVLAGLALGGIICGHSSEKMGVHDHVGIVWDEFVGIWLVLILLPEQTWVFWLAAFMLFRLFDIWKPWPIRWVDHRVKGGVGIMLDDILAALYALSIIWIPYLFFLG